MALPSSILLKSNANSKYLRYSKEDADVSHLRFSQDEDEEMNEIKCLQFEIQNATEGEGLVHIRATHNHKYLVRKSAESNYLVAEASEPEEDQTKWSSTLFKPTLLGADSDEPKKIQLVHIDQLGERHAYVSGSEGDLVLRDDASSGTDDDVFMLYDADSIAILPDYVAFVASNGNIGASGQNISILLFNDNTSIATVGVPQIVHQYPLKRQVQFTNMINQVHWTVDKSNDDHLVLFINNEDYPVMSFVPIKLGDNVIALLWPDQNLYLNLNSVYSVEGPLLCAGASSIVNTARFKLEEPVLDRSVTNVTYDLDNCRIYDTGKAELFYDAYTNYGSIDQTHTFNVAYVQTMTTSWKDSVTMSLGVKASFTAGVPQVDSAGVEITASISTTREWGEEVFEGRSITSDYHLTIPAGKKVVLQIITSTARCDVPFTCTVRDTLPDGSVRNYTKAGVFVGANQFLTKSVISEHIPSEPLKPMHKQSSITD